MTHIEHHQAIGEQLDQQTKCSLIDQLPIMAQISMVKIQKDGSGLYNTSWIKGEVILKMICQDGLVLLVKLPK